MTYLLDTNTCIRYLNGRSPTVRARLEVLERTDTVLCSVVKAELLYGAAKSSSREQTLEKLGAFLSAFDSLPFDDTAANEYAKIRAALEKTGTPIGPNDLMIAAIAVANRLTLVTFNVREFSRVPGLTWTDWDGD